MVLTQEARETDKGGSGMESMIQSDLHGDMQRPQK